MLRKTIISLFVVVFLTSAAVAQKAHTPKRGSKERKAVLNAVRVPVQKDLKQKIIFIVDNFNVSGRWAFVSGEPRARSGGKPNYKGTKFEEDVEAGFFDENFFALVKRTKGKWKVVTYEIGCTDVCYLEWQKAFKTPKSIFPHNQ